MKNTHHQQQPLTSQLYTMGCKRMLGSKTSYAKCEFFLELYIIYRVNKSTNEAAVPHNISQDCEQGEEMRKGRLFFLVHTFLTKLNELRKG